MVMSISFWQHCCRAAPLFPALLVLPGSFLWSLYDRYSSTLFSDLDTLLALTHGPLLSSTFYISSVHGFSALSLSSKIGRNRAKHGQPRQNCVKLGQTGWPSLGWWVTKLGLASDYPCQLSSGVSFVSNVYVPNSISVVCTLLVGDHPWVGGWPSLRWWVTLLGMVDDYQWQMSPGVCFISRV